MTPAPQSRRGPFLFLGMLLLTAAADLASKEWIFATRGMPGESLPIWLVQDILSFETSLNEGALFGMGAGWGVLFISLSFVAMLGIGYWVFRGGAAHDLLLCFALGCVTGGIIGNLYDRLGLPGLKWTALLKGPDVAGTPVRAVRDFIHFQYRSFDWPIFNLADSFLVCGVGLLIFHAYVWEPRQLKAAQRTEPAAARS